MAAPTEADFQTFFSEFRAAALVDDRARVASMFALPFRDFAGGDLDRSARTREQVLAQYDGIFTPDVVAAIRTNEVRAFRPGSDDGEAPGPIALGEFLLDTPEWSDQLVFSPKDRTFVVSRAPF